MTVSGVVAENADERWFDAIEPTTDPWRYWFRKAWLLASLWPARRHT